MAGTALINAQVTWTPTGWIFNHLLERVGLELQQGDPELAEKLFEGLGPTPGRIDIRQIPAQRFQHFAAAVAHVRCRIYVAGPAAMHGDDYYRALLAEADRLMELLQTDPRAGDRR